MKKQSMRILGVILLMMVFLTPGVLAADEESPAKGLDSLKDLFGIGTSQSVSVAYRTHVQNEGWETTWATNETTAGSEGQGLRLEGIEINLMGDLPTGAKIEYQTHVENDGWEPGWKSNGGTSGTVGRGLRLEGIRIRLVNMPGYSVQYRTHVQDDGWETVWVKDGDTSGTVGRGLRLEGIQIRIVKGDVDLTAYQKIIATINNSIEGNYTNYSWANLETVVADNIMTEKNTQAEVDAATAAIQAAYNTLESEAAAKVYTAAGSYGPSSGLEIINKDVVIKAEGVTLRNLQIKGDLIISEEVGTGNATLNNVTVEGETLIRGGGKNSIHINGGSYNKITIQNTSSGQVRVIATDAEGVEIVIAEDAKGESLILEGEFDSVQVDASSMKISTQGSTVIKAMTMGSGATGSQVNLDSDTRVDKMVFNGRTDVKGLGRIVKATVNVDSITYEKAPEQQTVAATVKVPPKVPGLSVTSVTVSSTGNVATVTKGGTVQMLATVLPAAASNKSVTWSVVDGSGKATISSSGVLTGVSAGTVTVKATSKDGSGKIGAKVMTVGVASSGTIAATTTIANGTANPTILVNLTNDTFTSSANITSNWTVASGTTGLTVSSISKISDTQVMIYTKGTATAGTLSMTANAGALTKKTASNTMSVTIGGVKVTSLSVYGTNSETTVKKGSTLQMLVTVSPSNATTKSVTWTVTNGTGSATITAAGLLKGVTAGSVTVKATATDGSGETDTQVITVQNPTTATLSTTSAINIGAVNPSIVVTLTGDTFLVGALTKTNWTVAPGTTGLTLDSITMISATQITITTTGTAKAGTLTLTGKAAALTSGVASTTLSVIAQPVTVTATAQTVTNAVGQTVKVKSSQATGSVYIISAAVTPSVVADLNTAIAAKIGASATVTAANTDISISTAGLLPGSYYAYAVDGAGKLSAKGASAITVTAADTTAPEVTAAVQNVTDAAGQTVIVKSSEGTGAVYIILDGETQNSVVSLNAAVTAKKGAKTVVTSANANISVSTAGLVGGTYYAYAVDSSGNISVKGTNAITVADTTKPIATVTAQSATNAAGQTVKAKSNEGTGMIYVVLSTETQGSIANFETAISAKKAAKATVTAANTDVSVSTTGLLAGTYNVYAVDGADNISIKVANVITVVAADIEAPTVTAEAQSVTNAADQFVDVESSEATGAVYIILDGEAQDTVVNLDAAVTVKKGAKTTVTSANVAISVSTAGLDVGTYHAYAVDGAGNISDTGTNAITITAEDAEAPTVTANEQSVTNATGQTVQVQSSETNGTVYIILDGEAQGSVSDFETAVTAKKGAKATVTSTDEISLSTADLAAGTYYAYAVDAAGNISDVGTNAITVTD